MLSKVEVHAPVWQVRQVNGQCWRYASVGGVDLRCPVVLLHGFPDCAAHWLPVAQRLNAAGYLCLVPELPGYGGTDPLPQGHDVQSIAEALHKLMVELAPGQKFYLAGHDWGAVIAYALCALEPERVLAAVTMAVPPLSVFQRNLVRHPGQLRRSWYMGYFQLGGKPEAALADPTGALLTRLWQTWSPAISDVAPFVAQVQLALGTHRQRSAALGYYRALLGRGVGGWSRWRSNYRLAQRKLTVPTRIIAGLQDGCVGPEIFADCTAAFTQAELCDFQVLPHAGHFMNIDQPVRLAELMCEWFDRD